MSEEAEDADVKEDETSPATEDESTDNAAQAEENNELDESAESNSDSAADADTSGGSDPEGDSQTPSSEPVFAPLTDQGTGAPIPLGRFNDVKVNVSAQLGSVSMQLGQLLQLGEGSVIELNRAINEPVDLMAQGVRIARGEVVVIDDCFAIRIKEIENDSEAA